MHRLLVLKGRMLQVPTAQIQPLAAPSDAADGRAWVAPESDAEPIGEERTESKGEHKSSPTTPQHDRDKSSDDKSDGPSY